MSKNIFDLWANNYDKDVDLTDDKTEFPFAGYKAILNEIYGKVMAKAPCSVLDVGIGTGVLAARLHGQGCRIVGIDSSKKMLKAAKKKMKGATLILHDFVQGMPAELEGQQFDFIISAYALHHIDHNAKMAFAADALGRLTAGGAVIIGDIAFEDTKRMYKCKAYCEHLWDSDEFYIIFPDFAKDLPPNCSANFRQMSFCGGIIEIVKN